MMSEVKTLECEHVTRFDSIERAVADIAAGKAVVVVDDEDRENEGDLIFAAEKATPELVAFMVRYTSGYLCVPLDGDDCDRLGLPPMYATNQDKHGTAYTVTVDAREGIGTGISASDRAATMRLLADPDIRCQRFHPARPRRSAAREGRRSAASSRATPRLPSTSPAWRTCVPPASSARSSARRTRARWLRPTSCESSPTNTTSL